MFSDMAWHQTSLRDAVSSDAFYVTSSSPETARLPVPQIWDICWFRIYPVLEGLFHPLMYRTSRSMAVPDSRYPYPVTDSGSGLSFVSYSLRRYSLRWLPIRSAGITYVQTRPRSTRLLSAESPHSQHVFEVFHSFSFSTSTPCSSPL